MNKCNALMVSSPESKTNVEEVRETPVILPLRELALVSMDFCWVSFLIDVLNRMLLYLPFHLGVAAVHD